MTITDYLAAYLGGGFLLLAWAAMTAPPDWNAADKAYQLHHTGCATCRAAGTAPGSRERCPAGRVIERSEP